MHLFLNVYSNSEYIDIIKDMPHQWQPLSLQPGNENFFIATGQKVVLIYLFSFLLVNLKWHLDTSSL